MVKIQATLSSIENFNSQCNNNYATLFQLASELLSRTEQLLVEVQEDEVNINKQIIRLESLNEEISSKVDDYRQIKEDAAKDILYYEERIDYLENNPTEITKTDDEGNEYTESYIDYEAIHEAERKRDLAKETYEYYRNKYENALPVMYETHSELIKFKNTESAIIKVEALIEQDIYDIKKYISELSTETEYNLQTLARLIERLKSYLASKPIYMPAEAHYEEFTLVNGESTAFTGHNSTSNLSSISNTPSNIYTPNNYEKTNQYFVIKTNAEGKEVKVFDHPEKSTISATYDQGCVYNGETYLGTCGLCSISTLLKRAGIIKSERDVVEYAVKNGLCCCSQDAKPSAKGGTIVENRAKIAGGFNLEMEYGRYRLEDLAQKVENGQGVIIAVLAGERGYNPKGRYNGVSGGHAMVLNSVERDAKTNKILAYYVIDSNGETAADACVRVPAKQLELAFKKRGSQANITKNIIW